MQKLHLENSLSPTGHENFTASGKWFQGKMFVTDLSDQDFTHDGKRTCQSPNAPLMGTVIGWKPLFYESSPIFDQ